MGFGEAVTRLLARLKWQLPDKDERRLVLQTYIAYYLLEYGYLADSFFQRFTGKPDPIVVPDGYRFIAEGTQLITEILCHSSYIPITIVEVFCHLDVPIHTIVDINCHNISTVANIVIQEVNCH